MNAKIVACEFLCVKKKITESVHNFAFWVSISQYTTSSCVLDDVTQHD